ncbi:unnamed protein product, partial [Prorocentrum cordatum]
MGLFGLGLFRGFAGFTRVVQLLIGAAADVDKPMAEDVTPLFVASLDGADGNRAKIGSLVPLHAAALHGHMGVVRHLCEQGVDLDAQNTAGMTSLLIAASQGHLEVVDFLQQSGADAQRPTVDGSTPLTAAAELGHLAVAKLLTGLPGTDVDRARQDGSTAVLMAAMKGHEQLLSLLSEARADVARARCDGATPLFVAAHFGHRGIVETLCQARVPVDIPMDGGLTALGVATRRSGSSGHQGRWTRTNTCQEEVYPATGKKYWQQFAWCSCGKWSYNWRIIQNDYTCVICKEPPDIYKAGADKSAVQQRTGKNTNNPQTARQRMLRSGTQYEQQTRKLSRLAAKRAAAQKHLEDCEQELTDQSVLVHLAEKERDAAYAEFRALRGTEAKVNPNLTSDGLAVLFAVDESPTDDIEEYDGPAKQSFLEWKAELADKEAAKPRSEKVLDEEEQRAAAETVKQAALLAQASAAAGSPCSFKEAKKRMSKKGAGKVYEQDPAQLRQERSGVQDNEDNTQDPGAELPVLPVHQYGRWRCQARGECATSVALAQATRRALQFCEFLWCWRRGLKRAESVASAVVRWGEAIEDVKTMLYAVTGVLKKWMFKQCVGAMSILGECDVLEHMVYVNFHKLHDVMPDDLLDDQPAVLPDDLPDDMLDDAVGALGKAVRSLYSDIEVDLLFRGIKFPGWAIRRGSVEIASELCQQGVDMDVENQDGLTPMLAASINGHAGVVQVLSECRANLNGLFRGGVSPLHAASCKGHVDVVRFLCQVRCHVDAARQDGSTPLLIAIRSGHEEVVQILCDNGADRAIAEAMPPATAAEELERRHRIAQ